MTFLNHLPRRLCFGFYLALGLATLSSFPIGARADFILHAWEDQHEDAGFSNFKFSTFYYRTGSNFKGPQGSNLTPAGFNDLQKAEEDFTFRYGLSQRISFYGRITASYVEADSSIRSGTHFGMGDQSFGLTIRLFESPPDPETPPSHRLPALDLQIQSDIPFYNVATAERDQKLYLGDGTVDLTPGLFANIPFNIDLTHQLNTQFGVGFTFRSQQFSSALPWIISGSYLPLHEGYFAEITGFGFVSLRNDGHSASSLATSPRFIQNASSGGSLATSAINPTLIQLRGKVGYQWSPEVQLSLAAQGAIAGQSAPEGYSLFTEIQFRLGNGKATKKSPFSQTAAEYGQANQGFIHYSLEAKVIKINERLNLVKIDKGSQDGIKVGDAFDLFENKVDGTTGNAIARGRVIQIKDSESAIELTDFFQDEWPEAEFIAKRVIE